MSRDPEAAQQPVVRFLADGAAYGRPGADVERHETHAARVFLIGGQAYKMKRAVRYSFLDFTTLERRRAVLEAELRLNRRTAPQLYRRLLPVTRGADGALALDGEGAPVEWLLEMARFDQKDLLDCVAVEHGLDARILERLAERIVAFHEDAEVRRDQGGHAGMAAVIDGNASDLRSLAGEVLPADEVERLTGRTRMELERRSALLEARREAGRVRHCHGDLHLGNIVLFDGEPLLFDCLEFDEGLACTDVLYDLAFLLMDLLHRDLRPAAQQLLGHYLELDPDDGGLALLPLFLSVRAAIRAKVQGFSARLQDDPKERADEVAAARAYLDLALGLLDPPPARLIAIGGLSGSGKSTVARALAPDVGAAPGAVVLRSDRLRKRLMGVAPTTRLGGDAYTEEVTAKVYATIETRAAALLRAGHGVIADAVYGRPEQRKGIEHIAAAAGARFDGLWLDVPPEVMSERIESRRDDASDATAGILRRQLALDLGTISWQRLPAGGSRDDTLARARACLRL